MFSKLFLSFSSGKKIAMLAVFMALSVVANYFSITLSPSNKITFTYTLAFFAGYLLGGIPAFLIAFLGDTISFFLAPDGAFWFFGVTLGLFALLCGALMNYLPFSALVNTVITLVLGFLIYPLLLNPLVNYWYVIVHVWHGAVNKTFWVYLVEKVAWQSLVYGGNCVFVFAVLPVAQKLKLAQKKSK